MRFSFLLYIATFFLILSTSTATTQDTIITASASNFYSNEFMNSLEGRERKSFLNEQEENLVNQAMRLALFKAYPSSISAASVKYSENISFNQFDTKTKSVYKRFMYDFANGEIVKCLEKDCRQFMDRGEFCIECTATIKARGIKSSPININVESYDGTDMKLDKETDFNSGQDFYLYFKTPLNGYLAVYFDDFSVAQRLLPYYYDSIHESCIQVKADTPYFLFSKDENHDMFGNPEIVDELTLSASSDYDLNRLYVVFSITPFDKPMLDTQSTENETARTKGEPLNPKQSPNEIFMEWLQKNRLQHDDFQIRIIDISTKK